MTGTIYKLVDNVPFDSQIAALQQSGWFPPDKTWWFGWNETRIAFPSRLQNLSKLMDSWDMVHVFSAKAEVRRVRRGSGWLHTLLTERETGDTLPGWQRQPDDYTTQETHRILWGERLRMAQGEGRGVVQFPRPMEYDVAGEGPDRYGDALIVAAVGYYDPEQRLQTVRWSHIYHDKTGSIRLDEEANAEREGA